MRILLITLLFSKAILLGQESADMDLPAEIYFINGLHSDVWNRESDAAIRRKITTTPNITNVIFETLWRAVKVKNETAIGVTLDALSLRSDVNREQVAQIVKKMNDLQPGSAVLYPPSEINLEIDEQSFLGGGLLVLKRHGTPEHEDLVLTILNNDKLYMDKTAATILGRIGTEKSVEPLRKYADKFRKASSPQGQSATEVVGPERELMSRLAKKQRDPKRDVQHDSLDAKKNNLRMNPENRNPIVAGNVPWWSWVVGFVIAGTAVAWTVRLRFQKKR